MFWISRKILTEVLPNPYNPSEKIKKGKANQVFGDIQKEYLSKYVNTWDTTVVPADFFISEYCNRSGQDREKIAILFERYFEERTKKLEGTI